jgi:hypothetical protein
VSRSVRPILSAGIATAAATLVAAPAALAADPAPPALQLSLSSSYTYGGAKVTGKVRSDTAGPIVIAQARVSRLDGPGRCSTTGTYTPINFFAQGKALRTIDYPTPGAWVSFSFSGGSLQFVGGNPYDSVVPRGNQPADEQRCLDPLTQFTKLAAVQGPTEAGYSGETERPLTRIF